MIRSSEVRSSHPLSLSIHLSFSWRKSFEIFHIFLSVS
jgi:hypothetical protein